MLFFYLCSFLGTGDSVCRLIWQHTLLTSSYPFSFIFEFCYTGFVLDFILWHAITIKWGFKRVWSDVQAIAGLQIMKLKIVWRGVLATLWSSDSGLLRSCRVIAPNILFLAFKSLRHIVVFILRLFPNSYLRILQDIAKLVPIIIITSTTINTIIIIITVTISRPTNSPSQSHIIPIILHYLLIFGKWWG